MYSATVIDYYGDYTATTTCNVFAPSPTPTMTSTPTPTPTPVPSAPSQICLQNYNGSSQFNFGFAGYNGYYPYFTGTSFNTVFNPTNGYWYLSGWTGTGIMINSTLSYSPLGSWTNIGSTVIGENWNMISGSCSTAPLFATLTQTNETCLGSCNGTITVNASGGIPPYTYQVNYGASQSSNFFSGL
ncbi:MAG: SprB repeat-containing protein, partial [bacterium]